MGVIHVLDTEVSNKIAAGEVVERPLSIVKELVENSIDAGASVITAEIRGGGIEYIRVSDNGSGMSAEDASICFLRHATSKISTGRDLEAIYTLGFRGEALSSIGAVSKVRLYTKRREDGDGICVECEGGDILSSEYAGAPDGTVIEVTDLFYNTPARLKFLKKPSTEAGYISDMMARFVFAHPEISFKLIRDGKEVIFSSGDNKLINAVYAVYGKDYARNMLEVDHEFDGVRVRGAVGKGTLTRANRNYESFFVNKRYIKSPILIRALEEAYKNQIMISKFPTAILNIELDASAVDINVHPTKLECKFSDESGIYRAVYNAVKQTLYALPNVPEIERGRGAAEQKPPEETPLRGEQKTLEELYKGVLGRTEKPRESFKFRTEHRETPRSFAPETYSGGRRAVRAEGERVPAIGGDGSPELRNGAPCGTENKKTEAERREEKPEETRRQKLLELMENGVGADFDAPEGISEVVSAPIDGSGERPQDMEQDAFAMLDYALERSKRGKNKSMKVNDPGGSVKEREAVPDNLFSGGYTVIGQLFGTYILAEKDDRLLMIDQHAAHERLNYERLKRELEESGINSQMLIEPVTIRLTGEEYAAFSDNSELFYRLGFDAEPYGENTVIIRSAPGEVSWSEIEPLFTELVTQAADMKLELISEEKQRLIYTIACKASVKANMRMDMIEMQDLAGRVFALENINTCPHGRPIVISMSKKEIEKEFKRIV